MTAEIAIMNKNAIALAADSAVTVETGTGKKIFNTAEKLFSLSKYRPVGIMMYDSASIMGVPWESVIKVYRVHLGKRSFPTLQGYANHFLKWLAGAKRLFPQTEQTQHFLRRTSIAFRQILSEISQEVKGVIAARGSITHSEVGKLIEAAISEAHKQVQLADILPHIGKSRLASLRTKYLPGIRKTQADVFQKMPISRVQSNRLADVAIGLSCRDVFPFHNTGIVIAGFGEEEIYPSFCEYEICSVLDGVLKFSARRTQAVSGVEGKASASIIPFAQGDMVYAFMEGVDPGYRQAVDGYLGTVLQEYPVALLKQIPGLSEADMTELTAKFRSIKNKIMTDFATKMDEFGRNNHVVPVLSAISILSKDMLAEVAESLVNLTSFKRRISMNSAETVGGPIDVAVISRGDGFVWIKRKHYFNAELNPHFVRNYFGDYRE